jgi:15-cis-phytoene synthase
MTISLSRSYSYCERLARREAANFYPAFRVLPGGQRRAMCALYAFLRVTDDLADGPGTDIEKRIGLTRWRGQFAQALSGDYSHPIYPAFHHTLTAYAIPRAYLDSVLDGVEMDLSLSRYSTFTDLYGYCYRVASAVGLACIHIWGLRTESAKDLAESAGVALQLTNILRDLREDAARGRIYLPEEDLKRFRYDAEELSRGALNLRFQQLMEFQVARARVYYHKAKPLAKLLEPAGRAVFQVILATYEGLLNSIEQCHYDVFSRRVSLSRWRKLSLVAQALPARLGWM